MAKLTPEAWQSYNGKLHWMKVRYELANIHLQIIEKWLAMHVSGWWYFDKIDSSHYLYAFQNDSEMVAFKMWLADRPFDKEHGEIDEKEVL